MANFNDAYNELKLAAGYLSDIDIPSAPLQTINTSVQAVDHDVQQATTAITNGFNNLDNLVNSTNQLLTTTNQLLTNTNQLLTYENQLLTYEIEQNNTIICYLEKITRQTCALLNESARQTAADEEMARDIHDLEQLYELANPAAAVEQDRLEALKHQVERCCPPPKPEPPCKFEPCPRPGDIPPPPSQSVPGPPVAQIVRKPKKAN
jgi:paraquat-inducible protein B